MGINTAHIRVDNQLTELWESVTCVEVFRDWLSTQTILNGKVHGPRRDLIIHYQCEPTLKLLDTFLYEPVKCNLIIILLVFSKLQPAD